MLLSQDYANLDGHSVHDKTWILVLRLHFDDSTSLVLDEQTLKNPANYWILAVQVDPLIGDRMSKKTDM